MAIPVHVVAGILSDRQGRVLIAQRPTGKHFAGRWEFPGGKLEPGETPQGALRRELQEELGVHIGAMEPLIGVPWRFAEKSIFLDVFRVIDFAQTPHGREGQALRWVTPGELASVDMPPPDLPIVTALRLPAHYAITPEPDDDDDVFLARLDTVLSSGIRLLQLRAKSASPLRVRRLAQAVQALARERGATLLLNGDTEMARSMELDGVHLPSRDLMRLDQRPLGTASWVAASCHNSSELAQAARLNLDFVVLGPVLPTVSHPKDEGMGWERFAHECAQTPLPVYALGGLSRNETQRARQAGAQGVAGISAFFAGR